VFGLVENTETGSKPSVPKLTLTLHEASQALSVSPITVRRLHQRGLLRRIKAIRHLRFSIKEVERFIAATSEEVPLGRIRKCGR
jgi:hypothetical protein